MDMELTITMDQSNSQNNGQNTGDGQSPAESTETPVTSSANSTSSSASAATLVSQISPVNSTAPVQPPVISTSSNTATSPAVPTLSLTLTSPVNQTISVTATLPVTSPVTRPLPPISTSSEIQQTPITRPLPPISTSSSIPQSSATTATYEQTTISDDSPRCGRCRSWGRTLFHTSPDKYCCIIPAKIWLKIRLVAIFFLLVGLFLVIIFPLPGMILFQVAVALLTVSAAFVLLDIGRGAVANCWCKRFEESRPQPPRVRTIEVIGNTTGFEEYDNPAFQGDFPPDYATAIATTPAPHEHGHQRPPNITINIEPSDQGTTADDVRTNVAFDSSISPSSVFSFNEPYSPRSLPPSYDDVIKEDNDRQTNTRSHDDASPGPSSS